MFRKLKIFFFLALVIGLFSLVFFLFYSTRNFSGKLTGTSQYLAILKTKYFNEGSKQVVEEKLRKYISELRKNNSFTGTTRPTSSVANIDGVKVPSTPNSYPKQTPSVKATGGNGGDKVDQLIQNYLEKSKPELHSEGDEPVESKDDTTTPTEYRSEEEESTAPSAVSKPPSEEEDEDLELCPEKPKSLSKYINTMSDLAVLLFGYRKIVVQVLEFVCIHVCMIS